MGAHTSSAAVLEPPGAPGTEPPAPNTLSYRPDLDGLRSIAVYLVLLFHTGLAWVKGGFIGVDLFFVLSGFLVTSVLLSELAKTGGIKLGRFYSRRVRRLLPAAWWSSSPPSRPSRSCGRCYSASRSSTTPGAPCSTTRTGTSSGGGRLLRDRHRQEPVPALLVAGDRGAVLRRLPGAPAVAEPAAPQGDARCRWAVARAVARSRSSTGPTRARNHAYYGTDARLYQLLAGAMLAVALHTWRTSQGGLARLLLVAVAGLVGLLRPRQRPRHGLTLGPRHRRHGGLGAADLAA